MRQGPRTWSLIRRRPRSETRKDEGPRSDKPVVPKSLSTCRELVGSPIEESGGWEPVRETIDGASSSRVNIDKAEDWWNQA